MGIDKFFHIPSLRGVTKIMSDTLIIPEWVFQQLHSIVYNDKESVGYIVARKDVDNGTNNIIYIAEGVIVTNIGDVTNVTQPKKVMVDSPDYEVMEFHTHTQKLGRTWWENFSAQDKALFEQRLKQFGEHYKHVLFTPTHILTWAQSDPLDVRIALGSDSEVKKIFLNWRSKLKHAGA